MDQKKKRTLNHFQRFIKVVYKKTQWTNLFRYIILPIITVVGIFYYDVKLLPKTLYLLIIYFNLSFLGFNAGYHKYYTHGSFSIDSLSDFLPWLLLVFGSSCGIIPLRQYIIVHRLHHKHCDSNKDPHNYRKNFLWAHIGWLVLRSRRLNLLISQEEQGLQEEPSVESARNEKLIAWQEEYNTTIYFFSLVIPGIIAGHFWQDFVGGVVYAGLVRSMILQQCIFSIDSLGHLVGTQQFDDKKTVRDSFLVSIITYGQGCNNFHHQFPKDYRGGYSRYRFDPSGWLVSSLSYLGAVKNLHETSSAMITRCILLQQQRVVDRHRDKLNWGVPINNLPLISAEEFRKLSQSSERSLVIVNGVVHDITPFVHNHPGGVALIKSSIGKDATSAFNGAVYNHSNAANNLLATMRIALIKNENTTSVLRQNRKKSIILNIADTADAA